MVCLFGLEVLEFFELALFMHFALFDDEDSTAFFDGADAMGNGDGGETLRNFVERLLDSTLVAAVEGRCGFVKYQ